MQWKCCGKNEKKKKKVAQFACLIDRSLSAKDSEINIVEHAYVDIITNALADKGFDTLCFIGFISYHSLKALEYFRFTWIQKQIENSI